MDENDYVRKDVYDAETDHLLSLILERDKRIDDLKDNMNNRYNDLKDSINRLALLFTVAQFGLAVILYFLR